MIVYDVVEYGHVDHEEWTVKVWWKERESPDGYSVWVPAALEWSMFVPADMREELEEILSYGRVTGTNQSAHDLKVPRFRPTNATPSRRLGLRPDQRPF